MFHLEEEQAHLDKKEQARTTKDEDSSDSEDAKTPEEIEVDPVGPSAPTAELEILSGGLHHIATLKGKQPFHERPPVILQTITRHSSQGGTVATDVEPVAAQEPTRVQMSSQTASRSGQTTTATSNGGVLLSSTRDIFSGKLDQSKQFLADFEGWALLNHDKGVFVDPFKKTAIFLTYLKGPDVNDWVAERRKILVAQPNDRLVWDNTRADFIDAFKDTGKQIITLHELEGLKMKPGEVDAYISRFNRLLPIAGFNTTDSGVTNMFVTHLYDEFWYAYFRSMFVGDRYYIGTLRFRLSFLYWITGCHLWNP